MSVQTSKTVLKVLGIVDIILGVLVLLGSVLTLTGGGLLASGAVPMDQVEAGVSGTLVLVAGGVMLLMGCFSLAEGILAHRAAKDPSKAQPALVFAVISQFLPAGRQKTRAKHSPRLSSPSSAWCSRRAT